MVDRRYLPFSGGWRGRWTSTCYQTDRAAGVAVGDWVRPNYVDEQLRATAPVGQVRHLYLLGGQHFATVFWENGRRAEVPLRSLIPASPRPGFG